MTAKEQNSSDPPEIRKARELLAASPELAPMIAATGFLTALLGLAGLGLAALLAQHAYAKFTALGNQPLALALAAFWTVLAFLAPEHYIPRGLNLQQAAAETNPPPPAEPPQKPESPTNPANPDRAEPPPPPYY